MILGRDIGGMLQHAQTAIMDPRGAIHSIVHRRPVELYYGQIWYGLVMQMILIPTSIRHV
jgi:hypothetical protein